MKPVETKYVLRYSDEVKINKNAPEFSSISFLGCTFLS